METQNLRKLILYGAFFVAGVADCFHKESLKGLVPPLELIALFESSSRTLSFLEKKGYVNLDMERALYNNPSYYTETNNSCRRKGISRDD